TDLNRSRCSFARTSAPVRGVQGRAAPWFELTRATVPSGATCRGIPRSRGDCQDRVVEIRRCPGERIVWSGVPARYRFFRRQENTLGAYYALGTLYGLLVIPFLQDSAIDGRLNAHMLVSLLYPLLPMACLLSFVEWLIHRTVEYHVTDRRVIVAWRRWQRIERSEERRVGAEGRTRRAP